MMKACDVCAAAPPGTFEMHVCDACSFNLVQSGRRQARLAEARVLFELLNDNGLTPFREKIRAYLDGND